MMKNSEISNENVSCEHTQDGQHGYGYTCQHHAASIREIWGTLDLIFTFPGMQVTTIGITFCLVLSCFILTIPLSSVALLGAIYMGGLFLQMQLM